MKRLFVVATVVGAVAFSAWAFLYGTQNVAAKLEPSVQTSGDDEAPQEKRAAVTAPRQFETVRPALIVETARATNVVWQDWQNTMAAVKALNNIAVKAAASGRITYVQPPGKRVKRGEVLLQLEDSKEQAQLKSKLAALDLARSSLDRTRSLASKEISTQAALQTAETDVRLAEAEVAYQRAVIDDFVIRAQFDGQVGLHELVDGQRIDPGQLLFSYQSIDKLFAEFRIPVEFASEVLAPGSIMLETEKPSISQILEVSILSPEVDSDTSTIRMRANLPVGLALRPGMTPRISYRTRQVDNVIAVPDIAIIESAYGSSLFVVNADGAVQQRFVTVQGNARGQAAVASGLEMGENVVVTGQMRLYPGVNVTTRPFRSQDQAVASAVNNLTPGGH